MIFSSIASFLSVLAFQGFSGNPGNSTLLVHNVFYQDDTSCIVILTDDDAWDYQGNGMFYNVTTTDRLGTSICTLTADSDNYVLSNNLSSKENILISDAVNFNCRSYFRLYNASYGNYMTYADTGIIDLYDTNNPSTSEGSLSPVIDPSYNRAMLCFEFTLMSPSLYNEGYNAGNEAGYQTGYTQGESVGYQNGYSAGLTEASTQPSTALTIFSGIVEVGLLPVNVFLQFFNFEVFGINISALIMSIMTIAITIIVIRLATGKKDD